MIMFLFDDVVIGEIYEMYEKLFFWGWLNFNGCLIIMIMFVFYNFMDYKLVWFLFWKGYEIVVYSVIYRILIMFWKQVLYN